MLGSVLERIGIVATAIVAFLALFPFAGTYGPPERHFSVFGNRVPDDSPWIAVGLGELTLVLLELVRRRAHRGRTD